MPITKIMRHAISPKFPEWDPRVSWSWSWHRHSLTFPESFRFAPQVRSLHEPYSNKTARKKQVPISFTTWGMNEHLNVRGTNWNRNKKTKACTHKKLGKIRNFSSWSCFQYMTLHTCRHSLRTRWRRWAKSLTGTVSTPSLLSLSSLEGAVQFMVSPWASVGELAGKHEHNENGSGDLITSLRVLMGSQEGYDNGDSYFANAWRRRVVGNDGGR